LCAGAVVGRVVEVVMVVVVVVVVVVLVAVGTVLAGGPLSDPAVVDKRMNDATIDVTTATLALNPKAMHSPSSIVREIR
jgi:hypothetical protein